MIKVFGITGTNGKTTASWMLRNILEKTAPCGLIGTIEYIAGSRHYMPENTTPGKKLLTSLFDEMYEQGIGQCVMEVSSHGIAQNRTDNILFYGAGFTNLSHDHLDYHGTMEQYYQTKKSFFMREHLYSAVNIDDFYGKRLYGELKELYGNENVKSFSLEYPEADFYGKILRNDINGSEAEIYNHGKLSGKIIVPVLGKHFVSDALLATVMAAQANIPFDFIKSGIEDTKNIPGRMEFVGSEDDTLGIIDYAHTPDSLKKLLQTVNDIKRGKILCVFGCGGFRDKNKRELMGRIAGMYSDYCIITNDNPRGEPPENIAQAIEEGVHPTGCGYRIILDRYQAIKHSVSLSDKWDIIVVAGKGHENYQIIGSEIVPFNDIEVLKELLEKKYEKTYD